MKGKRILVVGYGKLGSRVAQNLSNHHEVVAVKRSPIESTHKVTMCFSDIIKPKSLENALHNSIQHGFDYLIYCLSPSERTEQGYRDAYLTGLKNVLSCLPNKASLKHIIFISSTSVYHQKNDEEVNELSSCLPNTFSGKVLLEAESFLSTLNIPSTAIRFSGIYGRTRSRLIDQVKSALYQGETLFASPGYTNRIHEDDCVGFICHLVDLLEQQQTLEACYIGTDSCPVKQADVYRFIADQLRATQEFKNLSTGFKIENADATKSSRRAGSKQCNNQRMKQSGYSLKFESYKEGYLASLKNL